MKHCDILSQKMTKSLAFVAWLGCFLLEGAPALQAHELWIEPTKAHITTDENIIADLRIGDMFVGSSMIHLPGQTKQLAILTGDGMHPLTPRAGTRPVITLQPDTIGHIILIFESTDSYVRYEDGQKFFSFADKKGAGWVRDEHAASALPANDFVERYSRHAKASLSAGSHSPGQTLDSVDRQLGMEVEFTILSMTNQTGKAGETALEILLTYQGNPLANAPITLFTRAPDDNVSADRHRTGDRGTINLPALAGHDYLLDHVTLRQINPATDENGAMWESLWASLTFSGPQH